MLGGVDDDATPERIRALPSWLLARAALRAQRTVAAHLEDAGMRRQHYTVLATLEERGSASQAALGRALGLDRSDLHAIVTALEADALVTRERDPEDRRRNAVRLTAKGRRALARLQTRIDAAQTELLAGLSATDRRELLRLLDLLVAAG